MLVLWFVSNVLFVALLIAFLFLHRSVKEAARRPASPPEGQAGRGLGVEALKRWRLAVAVISAVMFVVMSATLLIDLYIQD